MACVVQLTQLLVWTDRCFQRIVFLNFGFAFLTASQIIFSSLNFFIISLKLKNFRSHIYFHLFY